MQRLFAAVLLLVSLCGCPTRKQTTPVPAAPGPQSAKLTDYYFVFLRRPVNAPDYPKEKLQEIQVGHMSNMEKMAAAGKLHVAGPFLDDKELRGIFVFTAAGEQEVRDLLKTDPAVQAGRLTGDIHPFRSHEKFGKATEPIKMVQYSMVMFHLQGKWKPTKELQSAEEQYIHALDDDGKLAFATSLGGPGTPKLFPRDLLILTVKPEEAEALAKENPYVKAGQMSAEVHPWMSAAGVLKR